METSRILFFGSPAFSATILRGLLKAGFFVCGVVTQPDKPKGRKKVVTPPAVKIIAEKNNIPVFQPKTLKTAEVQEQIRAFKPDLLVVASYGKILPKGVLDIPPHGCLNVHGSLLPKYRGASPIQAAILHGEPQTGVTIMLMDEGMDTGAILTQQSLPIANTDTAGTLSDKLAGIGAELLVKTIPDYLSKAVAPTPQDVSKATITWTLKKEAGQIDWTKSPTEIERFIRAMNPWPGAFFEWRGQHFIIKKAHLDDGKLAIDRIQPAGKKGMDFSSFLHGRPDASVDAFMRGS